MIYDICAAGSSGGADRKKASFKMRRHIWDIARVRGDHLPIDVRMKASFFSSSLSPSTPPRGGTKNSVDGSFTIVEGGGKERYEYE